MLYRIAITMLPGIGDITAKKLIHFCGSAQAVFQEKRDHLLKIPGIGTYMANALSQKDVLRDAEKELNFVLKNKIRIFYFEAEDYPYRLKQCVDSPVILYYKGNADLNSQFIVAVVGTRKVTAYGLKACSTLIEGISIVKPQIISGLAYGVDTIAHKKALEFGLQTVGVLAHGLDRVYPPPNVQLARKMVTEGALVTDFRSGTNPDRENFPKRNRIIAGLSDAVVVVEAASEGGALITADLANSYNREVFAVPGRWGDTYSDGCNALVKTNRSALIQSPQDLLEMMNWLKNTPKQPLRQHELLITLAPDEELLVRILQENGETGIDLLCLSSNLSVNKVASTLLQLELRGIVKALPGKRYCLPNR
ncbi:MAG: DNA-processing protein DprA [Bacteroidetes bacterium]|nr:DNA-processing protein DprA [Bacteroidota bacterium]